MDEVSKLALSYFQPPKDYFWRWVNNGQVIEWQNGTTICYQEELITILASESTQGLPQLGTLLLILTACQDNWKQSGGVDVLLGILMQLKSKAPEVNTEDLERYIPLAASFLDMVNDLPRELRTGDKKTHLIHEIFAGSVFPVPADNARMIVAEFKSGRLDELVFSEGETVSWQQLHTDVSRLILALREYKNKNNLELKLRTGVYKIPQKAEVVLPESLSLLEQLADDASTVGIARLTQRLIAALNIPMHAQGSGDQPFGGVSDITNRGNFDRLLLSELANDDDLLMARLVNSEALYLRREEPPDQIDRQRVILMDSTIKMWGIPRVFAISAALACAHNTVHTTSVSAYALGKRMVDAVDLASKKGIIEALERLDAGLDCGKALTSFMKTQAASQQTEYILIGDEQLISEAEFQLAIAALEPPLNYLVTVNRNGELHFYEYWKGRRKLVSSTKFDLDELLFSPAQPPRPRMVDNKSLPAFLNCEPAPLYFPTSGMRMSRSNTCYDEAFGVIGVNEIQRVLYWPKKETGARELLNTIEKGHYYFGFEGNDTVYIIVSASSSSTSKVYMVNLQTNQVQMTDFFQHTYNKKQEVVFYSNRYYVRNLDKSAINDNTQGQLMQVEAIIKMTNYNRIVKFRAIQAKEHIKDGYSVWQKVKKISINPLGELRLGKYDIRNVNYQGLKLVENTKEEMISYQPHKVAQRMDADNTLVANIHVRFTKFVWADGSEAMVDSRGLLHLRSSDTSLPEITIVLILGKETTCWASDGTVSGSYYFTRLDLEQKKNMAAGIFYKKYIQRFIDRLRS